MNLAAARHTLSQRLVAGFAAVLMLCGMSLAQAADATDPLTAAGEQLRAEGALQDATRFDLLQSADGLFVLAWLAESGQYGEPKDAERAASFYQLAAEGGSMAAAHYCWQRCLKPTEELGEAIKTAAAANDPLGQYLFAQWLTRYQPTQLQAASATLLQAAKQRQPDALNELYLQHFIDWNDGRARSFAEAEAKLQRCADEGLVVCYLLRGAFYQKHRDTQAALTNYLALQQLDQRWAQRYLRSEDLKALEERLTSGGIIPIEARAASLLAHHQPTGFDQVDRFQLCAEQPTYDCVQRMAQRDEQCMLGYFAKTYLKGLRQTPAYRRCMGY